MHEETRGIEPTCARCGAGVVWNDGADRHDAGDILCNDCAQHRAARLADVEAAARDARDWLVEALGEIQYNNDAGRALDPLRLAHGRLEAMGLGDGDPDEVAGEQRQRERLVEAGVLDEVERLDFEAAPPGLKMDALSWASQTDEERAADWAHFQAENDPEAEEVLGA